MKKKIRTLALAIMLALLPTFIFACTGKKPVLVSEITLSTYSINLRTTDEPVILTATIKPDKATNKNITFNLTDDSVVKIDVIDNNNVRITPKNVIGPVSTYIQATSEDGNATSAVCKVTVYTEKTPLFAPENLTYDAIKQEIVWDEIPAASGYMLSINNGTNEQEIACATNSFKSEVIYNKPITVKVKSVGDNIVYTDSEYTTELKFLQLSEPENLRNEDNVIYFSPVENAEKYRVYINDNFTKDIKASTYLEENGYELDLLNDAGNYEIKVQAIAFNDDDEIVKYDSTYENSISVTRFNALSTTNEDFKFTYIGKVLSWESVLGAEKFIISQKYNNETPVEIELSNDTTSYVLDTKETAINSLKAGIYKFKIRIVGNGVEYLNSDYSNEIAITKLNAPTPKVQNGKIVWENIEFNGGYDYILNGTQRTLLKGKEPSLSLLDNYDDGDYYLKLKTRGNEQYAIESDYSSEFKFTKLQTPATPFIENNKYLVLRAPSLVDYVEAHITYNDSEADVVNPTSYNTENIDGKDYKVYKIDLSASNFGSGSYKVYTRFYGKNYLKSNQSETLNFSKLNNINTSYIEDGTLKWTIPESVEKAEIYVGENLLYCGSKCELNSLVESDIKIENFKLEAGVDYSVKMKFIPAENSNVIISNLSDEKLVQKLAKPTYFYVENGDFVIDKTGDGQIKYNISSVEGENTSDTFTGKENIVYTINAFYFGGTDYLSSDTTTSLKVKVLSAITTLTLTGDIFKFESIGMPTYQLTFKTVDTEVNETKTLEISSNSFSLKDKIAESGINYENLDGTIKAYISYNGTTVYEGSNEVAILNRNWLSNEESPNEVEFKILHTPKELKVYGVKELMSGLENEINELYLVASSDVNMFELTVTNVDSNAKFSKILTTNNYLKVHKIKENSTYYKIDTNDWLDAGTYNFTVKSIEQNNMQGNVHIIDSLGTCEYKDAIKLSKVTSLSCSNNAIQITDSDTEYQYVLIINGKVIYDDILEEGQTINSFVSSISQNNISGAINTINAFKSKTRTLKDNYTGTFKVSARKYFISTNILEYLGGGPDTKLISSTPCEEIEITRIATVDMSLKNGFVQWTALDDFATSFEVIIYDQGEEEYTEKSRITVNKGDSTYYSGGVYKLNLNDTVSNVVGNYGVSIIAKTNLSGKLDSVATEIVPFEILQTPNLNVSKGTLTWTSVDGAKAYRLTIKKGEDVETQLLESTVYNFELDENYIAGTYQFTIQALGISKSDVENDKDYDINLIRSLVSEPFEAIKLETPTMLSVKKGKLVFNPVANATKYSLVNSFETELETLNFSTEYAYELGEKYNVGVLQLKYRALGDSTKYLNSDYSELKECYKLNKVATISVLDGELAWTETANYGYNLVIKQDADNLHSFTLSNNGYEMSKNDSISAGLYKVLVKALGDDEYFLNSEANELANVKKLYNVENVRIVDGILTWDKIKTIESLTAGETNVPNELTLIFEKENQFITKKLTGKDIRFVLGSEFEQGNYKIYFRNIGEDEGLYVNSKEIVVQNIRKLQAPENLNIDDGVNLKFTNKNTLYTNADNFKISMTQVVQEKTTLYEGVIKLSSSKDLSIEFDKLYYYEIVNSITNEKTYTLVNVDDAIFNNSENAYYYNGNKLFKINKDGKFTIKVLSFGNDQYINSEYCSEIIVTVPEPVTNLQVTHGKITWTASSDADKFILKITRTDLSGKVDEEFNKENSLIRVLDGCSYNLTDVNYIYTISVKAYSIKSDDESENMMASKAVEVGPITFNSFKQGNGQDIPYEIMTREEFNLIRYNNKASYVLTSDIDLTDFEPLFTKDNAFIGTLEGNGKHITNLSIRTYYDYSGIFGYISTKKITDIRVINLVETSTEKEFVGKVNNLIINSATITEGMTLGAIAGVNEGIISNIQILDGEINTISEPSVNIGATNKTVRTGSVAGINRGTIENVVNNAEVMPKSKTSIYAGGICAENEAEAKIINCENHAKIKGNIAGGICAINNGEVLACAFTSNIYVSNFVSESTSTLARAGGITGINNQTGVIANCTVYNSNFGIGMDVSSWGGIIDQSSANIGTDSVLIGGLAGKNIGNCEFNLVEIDLHCSNDSISVQLGRMFGHNENSAIRYNFAMKSTTDDAVVFAHGVAIDSKTNGIVQSFINLETSMNDSTNTYLETLNKSWILDNEYLILANN